MDAICDCKNNLDDTENQKIIKIIYDSRPKNNHFNHLVIYPFSPLTIHT